MVKVGDPEFHDIAIDNEDIGPWSVTVERNGEQVVTIASNHLSGRDISTADAQAIRIAARSLMSFLGSAAVPGRAERPMDEPIPHGPEPRPSNKLEDNIAELERQRRSGIGVFNPRFDPPLCSGCEHPIDFHNATGCRIEECGCGEALY